jgi:hypothetical protein
MVRLAWQDWQVLLERWITMRLSLLQSLLKSEQRRLLNQLLCGTG